ncbi:hypothetical protein AH06_273 [Erwinia phage AH06]|nr:hypothetical protein AH06_273 [Erwinia phage AH06]
MLKLLKRLFNRKKAEPARVEPAVFEKRLKEIPVRQPVRAVRPTVTHRPISKCNDESQLTALFAAQQFYDLPDPTPSSYHARQDHHATPHHTSHRDDSHNDTGASDYSSGSDSSSPSD